MSFPLSVSLGLIGKFSVGFFPAGVVPSVVLLFVVCSTDSSPTACGSLLECKKTTVSFLVLAKATHNQNSLGYVCARFLVREKYYSGVIN